jgi:hypothetical protein
MRREQLQLPSLGLLGESNMGRDCAGQFGLSGVVLSISSRGSMASSRLGRDR